MTFLRVLLLACLLWLPDSWATDKEQIEKEIVAVRAAQQQTGLTPGDIALLKAKEASLGLDLTSMHKEGMMNESTQLGIIMPASLLSRATAMVNYAESGHSYVIEYIYDRNFASIPAIQGASVHYADATVTVFEIVGGSKQQIGFPMGGTYVPGGCFEDVPSEWLMRARANSAGDKHENRK